MWQSNKYCGSRRTRFLYQLTDSSAKQFSKQDGTTPWPSTNKPCRDRIACLVCISHRTWRCSTREDRRLISVHILEQDIPSFTEFLQLSPGKSLNISLNRFVLHYWEIIMYMNHASEKMLWNKDYAYAYSLRNQPYTSGHPIVSFNLLLCTACSYCQGYTQQKTEQESNMRAPI